jgi:hypothetical protein
MGKQLPQQTQHLQEEKLASDCNKVRSLEIVVARKSTRKVYHLRARFSYACLISSAVARSSTQRTIRVCALVIFIFELRGQASAGMNTANCRSLPVDDDEFAAFSPMDFAARVYWYNITRVLPLLYSSAYISTRGGKKEKRKPGLLATFECK